MTNIVIPSIIASAFLESRTDTSNVDTASQIRYCDDIYQELIDEKKVINEDFIKKTSAIDTIVYQNKYSLPTSFEKMKQISIKYSAPTYTARSAGSVYAVGDKCTYNGKSYICNVAHTAGSVFEFTKTYTTSAIMVAGETITIDGVVLTAKGAGLCVNQGDFYIGLNETAGNVNLLNCIQSLTSGSATTFISLSTYSKNVLAKAEIIATNPTINTIVITSNATISTSETSTTGSWGSETGGNWIQTFEGYVPCTPRIVDFDFPSDFNSNSESDPVYFYENNELKIYPRPKNTVVQGILFDYIPEIETLTLITEDESLFMENKLQDAWVAGVAMKFADHIGKDSSKLSFDYQKGTLKCISRWKERHLSPIGELLPNSLLKYMR